MERSTLYFEITFRLVQNKRSIHDTELFIKCVGLSMICVYPTDDERESISQPVELVISPSHQFVQRALKSPVTIKQRGNSSFIYLRRISKFVQNTPNFSRL